MDLEAYVKVGGQTSRRVVGGKTFQDCRADKREGASKTARGRAGGSLRVVLVSIPISGRCRDGGAMRSTFTRNTCAACLDQGPFPCPAILALGQALTGIFPPETCQRISAISLRLFKRVQVEVSN